MGTGRLNGYFFKILRRGDKGVHVTDLECPLGNMQKKEICKNAALIVIFCVCQCL